MKTTHRPTNKKLNRLLFDHAQTAKSMQVHLCEKLYCALH